MTTTETRAPEELSPVFALADSYVTSWATLEPTGATFFGLASDAASPLTDYGPDAERERADLARRTLARLDTVEIRSEPDRIAAAVLRDRLGFEVDAYEAGEWQRPLSPTFGPALATRLVLGLAAPADAEAAERYAALLEAAPASLASERLALQTGIDAGRPGSTRLANALAEVLRSAAGDDPSTPRGLAATAAALPGVSPALARRLEEAGAAAGDAFGDLSEWLTGTYAPVASPDPTAGRERYEVMLGGWLGTHIDLDDTFSWGWEELVRIEDAMQHAARRVRADVPLDEVIDVLRTGRDGHAIEGTDAWVANGQRLIDDAIARLSGVEFDIIPELLKVECKLAPSGSSPAPYYVPPAVDGSRSGQVHYPVAGRESFPVWIEATTAYHEGVPGHHLEVGGWRQLGDRVSRFQSTLALVSGYSEGWALYAERLVAELGWYADDPVSELGFLAMQALRAARVVVDIGVHLGLRVPAHVPDPAAGEVMTPEVALDVLLRHGWNTEVFLRGEMDRYLSMPGQAISYKVGEREWLRVREVAERRLGDDFNLRRFHAAALSLGPLPLALLEDEVLRALAG
ncbi:MAG TPA: DUF885 domain-containing protein [Mycobacteriales bacterium]|nr:DUF885 domain-containing protein [Mycobacteriales bacterium]